MVELLEVRNLHKVVVAVHGVPAAFTFAIACTSSVTASFVAILQVSSLVTSTTALQAATASTFAGTVPLSSVPSILVLPEGSITIPSPPAPSAIVALVAAEAVQLLQESFPTQEFVPATALPIARFPFKLSK